MFGVSKIFKKNEPNFDLSKGLDALEADIRKSAKNNKDLADQLRVLAKNAFCKDPETAIRFMIESNELVPYVSKAKWLMFRFYELGRMEECKKYFDEIQSYAFTQDSEIAKLNKIINDIAGYDLNSCASLSDGKGSNQKNPLLNAEQEKKKFSSQAFILKDNLTRMSLLMKNENAVNSNILNLLNSNKDNLKFLRKYFLSCNKYSSQFNSIRNALSIKQLYDIINEKNRNDILTVYRSKKGIQVADRDSSSRDFVSQNLSELSHFHSSNGSRIFTKLDTSIGVICDEFYWDSVSSAANFIYLTPSNYESKIKEIDILLFVSTWNGLNKEWVGVASANLESKISKVAVNILKECKKNNIPTIFYSKEDPTNYDIFVGYSKLCDYVLTTDCDCLSKYKADAPNAKEYGVIQFGINPNEHNPIGVNSNSRKEVLFSGSWMKKYPERCSDIRNIFDGVINSDFKLSIIDRFYGQYDGKYSYPEDYDQYIYQGIEHKTLQKVHKLSPWSINVNTVKYSPTMFANRVFELQANGSLLLSNYSMGVNNILPTVFMIFAANEVPLILRSFSDEELYERRMFGVRTIYNNHTCYDRLKQILDYCSLTKNIETNAKILVVGSGSKEFYENYNRQSYPNKDCCTIDKLNAELLSKFQIITFFSDSDLYEEFYLEDMINAFKYTDCDYITKSSYLDGFLTLHEGTEHDYTETVPDCCRSVFWINSYSTEEIISKNLNSSKKGYSIDHFNYIANYKGINAVYNQPSSDYKLSIILPVYNNGMFLYGKSFASIRRLSIFNETEIIIVDDGSTDSRTISIIKYLERHYSNIKTFFFEKGGSGSASRPRNKGLSMAEAKYVIFVDPDDECINDSFSEMLYNAMTSDTDLIISNNIRAGDKIINFNNYNFLFSKFKSNCFTCENGLLISDIDYHTPRIQSMVIRTSIAKQISFIEGAIGEDTLYSWQVLKQCSSIRICDLTSHVYYSARGNSETNVIAPSMFNKLYLSQKGKISWLVDNHIMGNYMDSRFENYVNSWIFFQLNKSDKDNILENARLVYNIISLYAEYLKDETSSIYKFYNLWKQDKCTEALQLVESTQIK